MSKKIAINFKDSAVAIDKKGARYMTQAFDHPDGSQGAIVVMKLTKKNWNPDITNITIEFNED